MSLSLLLAVAAGEARAVEDVALQLLATLPSAPSLTGITHAGDSRLFLVEKTGRIFIYEEGVLLEDPFLDLSGVVETFSEQGLLGLAFHPNYKGPNNGYFFVHYTTNVQGGDFRSHISRFRVSDTDPNAADPTSEYPILQVEQPAPNHNGGDLHFGPDGFLYIALGDGGGSDDEFENGQDNTTLLGTILRIDVDPALQTPYAIPADNPLVGAGGGVREEIWVWGLRNPWRFSFDRMYFDLYIGDVGQDAWEEIDFQAVGDNQGQNYGWNPREGAHCVLGSAAECNDPTLVDPILEYPHSGSSRCSVTGGFVYRGFRVPQLKGRYVFADYCTGEIFESHVDEGDTGFTVVLDATFRITTFGQDRAGELLVGGRDGTVHRVVSTPEPRAALLQFAALGCLIWLRSRA